MWRKKSRPTAEEIAPRNDVDEARAIRAEVTNEMLVIAQQEGLVQRISNVMINRQGRNHYMELLYTHIPGGAQ